MGGVLTAIKQRNSSNENSNDITDENDDLTRSGFKPKDKIKHVQHVETHSEIDTTLFVNPETKETVIRQRTLQRVSSETAISAENRSETHSFRAQCQSCSDLNVFGGFRPKDPDSKKRHSHFYDEEETFHEPQPDYGYDYKRGNILSIDYQVEVHKPLQLPQLKIEMAKDFIFEKKRKEYELQVIKDTKFLPRFAYHRSLLNWFIEGIPQDPVFQTCHFTDCTILFGGNVKDETISKLCGETTLGEKVTVKNLEAAKHAHSLIVYFDRGDVTKEYQDIMQVVSDLSFKGTILFVMTLEIFYNEQIKSTIKEKISEIGISNVQFVDDNQSEILSKMTYILEQSLVVFLEQTKKKLIDYSRHHNVRSSLREVNAVLRRLKQAACYPEQLTDDKVEDDPKEKEFNEILQSFGDKIIYKRYDGDTMYVITTNQEVKEKLDAWSCKSGINNNKLVTTVDVKLSISELAKRGDPLHGAKIVYVNEDVNAFKNDDKFATTGSLMMSTGDSMVIVTSKHALKENEHVYTLIDGAVVRLGNEIPQPQNRMERLSDDIAAVNINIETRSAIDKRCEKLLIDSSGHPTPSQISLREVRIGDIVHKRGAKTGLTTGIVCDVKNTIVGEFRIPSRIIFIEGRNFCPFAERGDSGSLVFQHSLSVEDNILDVLAMVQGRVNDHCLNHNIVCFPFHEGRDTLIRNIEHLDYLQFYNV